MGLIKFSSITNIIFGVLLCIVGILLATTGVLAKEGELGTVLNHLIPAEHQDKANEILATIYSSPNLGLEELKKLVEVPQSMSDFFANTHPFDFLMYVGFGLVGYSILVHITLTSILLKKAKRADRGEEPAPRILALFVGILSIIPLVIPGVLMILGILGNTKRPLRRERY